MATYARAREGERTRSAGTMLAAGAVIHFIAAPIALILFKALVESEAGRGITWDELWAALSATGFLMLIVLGVAAQIGFGVSSAIGSALAFRGSTAVHIPMIISGVIALIFSLVVFGGLIGLVGGILTAVGGAKAKAAPPLAYAPAYRPPGF